MQQIFVFKNFINFENQNLLHQKVVLTFIRLPPVTYLTVEATTPQSYIF